MIKLTWLLAGLGMGRLLKPKPDKNDAVQPGRSAQCPAEQPRTEVILESNHYIGGQKAISSSYRVGLIRREVTMKDVGYAPDTFFKAKELGNSTRGTRCVPYMACAPLGIVSVSSIDAPSTSAHPIALILSGCILPIKLIIFFVTLYAAGGIVLAANPSIGEARSQCESKVSILNSSSSNITYSCRICSQDPYQIAICNAGHSGVCPDTVLDLLNQCFTPLGKDKLHNEIA